MHQEKGIYPVVNIITNIRKMLEKSSTDGFVVGYAVWKMQN
jgi:hypothetical protein